MHELPLRPGNGGRAGPVAEELWLLGQPPLQGYLDFVRDNAVAGEDADPKALCEEWRVANDYYYELEKSEAGLADEARCHDLDTSLAPLAEPVMASPWFRRSFWLPACIAMVELDRLIACQTHVSRQFVDELRLRLGPSPDPESLFHFCLPLSPSPPEVRIHRLSSRRFSLVCESSDFRFLEPVVLRAEQISGYESYGPIGGVVGLVTGFSCNFVNVVRSDNRLLLHNGYHRACALRELGVQYAPAVVQTVTRRDELAVAANRRVNESAAFYFRAARPPLLKDFSDPRIRKLVPVRPCKQVIEVSYEVRDFDLRD